MALRTALPEIELGNLKVSRLILGSNPFFGYSHRGKEADAEMRAYFTPERLAQLLDDAARVGMTAVAAPVYPQWTAFWGRYRDEGGKLATWIAQPDQSDRIPDLIDEAAHAGAAAIFVQGARVDEQFAEGRMDVLREWVERIRDLGLPAGLASHRTDTHLAVEHARIPTDFYFQCLFRPHSYRPSERVEALAAIRRLPKPVVAYKVLAASRLAAGPAFRAVMGGLRPTDGVCVGMYPPDNPAMLEENVRWVCGGALRQG